MTSAIVDTSGRPFRDSYHAAASNYSAEMAAWQVPALSADTEILPEWETLTGRARDLAANNGVAAGAPQTFADHVIGPRLRLQAHPDYRALGWSREQAAEWARDVERRFNSYARNPLAFDVEEQTDFTGGATIALHGMMQHGLHLVLPYWEEGRVGVKSRTCFLHIEGDRVNSPVGTSYSRKVDIRGGVEYQNNRPVAIYVQDKHPGDWLSFEAPARRWERIPLKTEWGRRRALLCFIKTRANMSRGKPAVTPAMSDFKTLARYRKAELNAAVSHALATFFVESHLPPEILAQTFTGQGSAFQLRKEYFSAANQDSPRGRFAKAYQDENMLIPVFPGDRIVNPKNSRPNEQFGEFSRHVLRHIAAAYGVSYETLLRDFSDTSYSTARVLLLMDWKRFLGLRSIITQQYCDPVYALWLEEQVNQGAISAPGFYDNLDAYLECSWEAAGRGWVDPAKEADAVRIRISTGVSNLAIEASEQGNDWETVMAQRVREIEEAFRQVKEAGLPEAAAYAICGMTPPSDMAMASQINDAYLQNRSVAPSREEVEDA